VEVRAPDPSPVVAPMVHQRAERPTFVFSFTKDSIVLVDCHQSDVVVINDVLRVFEAIVSTQEVVDTYLMYHTESVAENNIKDLC